MLPRLCLVPPKILPPLGPDFRPAVLANRAYTALTKKDSVPLVIGLERSGGEISVFQTRVLPENHPYSATNLDFAERLVKFLLWQRGAFRMYVGGPEAIGSHIRACYSKQGMRRFDWQFMGSQVYDRPFQVIPCQPEDVPAAKETSQNIGRHLEGARVGFDLGASDRKASAVLNGRVLYSEEVIWQPGKQADPAYHYHEITNAIETAAAHLPKLDAIGGSAAGIYINNQPRVASLFRSIPEQRMGDIRNLFERIGQEKGVPLVIINDGDVTALAGSMSLEDNGVLGIAMGSSQAAGYVDLSGRITGWLNELAFAPIDYSPSAPVDEWSGDAGCGASYLSQQCVFRLAREAGIVIPPGLTDADRLKFVQEMLETGHPGARKIWESMGIFLGYSLAHYAAYYQIRHALILGRCTSGQGGSLMLQFSKKVLEEEFPDLSGSIQIELPDEKNRRIGQAIAAASLPDLRGVPLQ